MTRVFSSRPFAMNCFYALLLITFILKCYFAALVPITGDEAEYAYWGEFPALGYYDHPPLIGWIMALVTSVSTHSLWLRLPQVLSSTVFAILMVRFLAHFEEGFAEKAYWIGCAYLLSPVSLFDQGILTDTPLMWFTFFSVLCLLHAESSRHSFLLYLLAGLSLGAAYFSKFLMFPVAFGILIYLLLARPLPHRLFKMTLIALGFLPFLLQTLWWNLHHDWVNFAFNLTLRNTNLHFSFNTVILYGLMMLYLFSPLLLYYLIYRMPLLFKQIRSPKIGASHAAILTSLLFFFGLSFSRSVGLHWIFCAYPFAFVSIAWITKASECKRIAKWMLFLILPQILIVIVAGNLSASTWKKILPSHAYQTINWFFFAQEMVPQIQPYLDQGFLLMTPSYADSYLLAYAHHTPASVWGLGSIHGRQDDLSSDFTQFNHKNVLVVDSNHRLNPNTFTPYFQRTEHRVLFLNSEPVDLWLGYDFHEPLYQTQVLCSLETMYYSLPAWLPRSTHWFEEKYHCHLHH